MRWGREGASILIASVLAGCGGPGPECIDSDEEDRWVPFTPGGPCHPCDDGDPCTMEMCNEGTGECASFPLDLDGDGHAPEECGGDDCDDSREDTHGSAREICADGVDQDCDTVVDGFGIAGPDVRITHEGGHGVPREALWTGSEIALVWENHGTTGSPDVEDGSRIGILGPRGDARGERYRPVLGDANLSVAWNGSVLGAIWSSYGSTGGYDMATLDVRGDEVRHVQSDSFEHDCLDISWTGEMFAVLYCTTPLNHLGFFEVDPADLTATDPIEVTSGDETVWHLDTTWTGSELLATWSPRYGGGIAFARLVPDAPADIEISHPIPSSYNIEPRLAWSGSEAGIVWRFEMTTPHGLWFVRVDRDGARRSEPVELTSASPRDHAIVWTGSEFAITWIEGPLEDAHLALAYADGDGIRREVTALSYLGNLESGLATVWTGTALALFWGDDRASAEPCEYPEPDGRDCDLDVWYQQVGDCE